MSDSKKDSTPAQPPVSTPSSDETATTKQLDEIADEMAGKAGKTESQYDEGHNIFTK